MTNTNTAARLASVATVADLFDFYHDGVAGEFTLTAGQWENLGDDLARASDLFTGDASDPLFDAAVDCHTRSRGL